MGAGVCDEQFTGSPLLVELKARSLASSREDENFLTALRHSASRRVPGASLRTQIWGDQGKRVIEVLHAQWAKERLVQNKRVSRSSIQENIRPPISLRPHQIARELRAIQCIAICKSTAPQWRFRAIWPKWTHSTCYHNPEWATADQWFLWPGQYCTSMAATGPPQWDAVAVPYESWWHLSSSPPERREVPLCKLCAFLAKISG